LTVRLIKYHLGEKIMKIRTGGHVARMGENAGAYSVLVGKSEGKTLRKPRRR